MFLCWEEKMANKEIMRDVNGNILGEREAKIFMNFQKRFLKLVKMLMKKFGDYHYIKIMIN